MTQDRQKKRRPSTRHSRIDSESQKMSKRSEGLPRKKRKSSSKRRTSKTRADYRHYEQREKASGSIFQKAMSFFYNLVFYGVTLGILLMSLMFAFSSKSNASIFGYRFYTVMSNSMAPQKNGPAGGFYAGDILLVRGMKGDQVKTGDIVTFAVGDSGSYLTHRVVEKMDELNGEAGSYLITKGDANTTNDPPIKADRVFGKVLFAVPKVGTVLEFVRAEFWACLVTVISLFGFFLVLKAYLFSPD